MKKIKREYKIDENIIGREMRNIKTGETINVIKFAITRHRWEYFITDYFYSENVARCLVMGFEQELGAVYLPEVSPHIAYELSKLDDVLPAIGWEWVS